MDQIIQPFTVTPYPGFTCQPLTEQLLHRINGLSYHDNDHISPLELRYLRIPYIDFYQETKLGEMICNYRIASALLDIFHTLYENQYPIERIQLVDDFQADDDLCCQYNNTSCFNYRTIAGTDTLSRHAFGMAVDVNPFYNPYVTFIDNPAKDANGNNGISIRVSPPGSLEYADRTKDFPHKLGSGDLCYELFISKGFTWGGDWTHCKDYQHFEYNQ